MVPLYVGLFGNSDSSASNKINLLGYLDEFRKWSLTYKTLPGDVNIGKIT